MINYLFYFIGLISEPLQAEVHPHRNRLSENNN